MKKIVFLLVNLLVLTGCSRKVTVEHLTLSPESPAGFTAVTGAKAPKAYLLLFPGFGESPDDVLASTDLPFELARHEIAVFIPVLQDGSESYGFSNASQECLRNIVSAIRERYNLHDTPYFAGGFSMGGATAVRFAETYHIKPKALFAIDSPLDYKRFLYATRRDIEVYNKDSQDSIYARLYAEIDKIKNESPYEIDDSTHSAIKSLVNIPVRFYIEPAEDWWINNRQTDVLGLNIIDATCFINDLRLMGNDNAELIVTRDKGFRRANHQRHPHSWSIVDIKNLLTWLKGTL